MTLNDPTFVEAARVLAEHALTSGAENNQQLLDFISQRALSRDFNDQEQTIVLEDQAAFLTYYTAHPDDAKALIATGASPVPEKLDPALLAAWTMVCNEILNLDEALNK